MGKGFLARPGLEVDLGGPPPGAGRGGDRGYRVGGATAGMGVHKGEGVFCSDHTGAAEGVEGLYAAGDALGSMMVGSVYPGRGFSSYGSAIQGRRAAGFTADYVKGAPEPRVEPSAIEALIQQMWAPRENTEGYSPGWVTQTLRNTMAPIHVLYIKEPRRLDGALASIEYLRQRVVPRLIAKDGHELRLAHETANMLLNAEMKLRAGLFRTESRGTHYREDFPARNDKEWLCWIKIRLEDGRMVLEKHPIPDEWRPDPGIPDQRRYPNRFPGEDEFLEANPDWA
ncbi:MAG: FAD-binding protein [bacterium]|nr:FAD-binding protein [bacterium]